MPAEITTLWWCPTSFARWDFPSSSSEETYHFYTEGEGGGCTCPGFKFRHTCKHEKEVWEKGCLYNPQWKDPGPDTLAPSTLAREDDMLGPPCPGCGRKMIPVRCAV